MIAIWAKKLCFRVLAVQGRRAISRISPVQDQRLYKGTRHDVQLYLITKLSGSKAGSPLAWDNNQARGRFSVIEGVRAFLLQENAKYTMISLCAAQVHALDLWAAREPGTLGGRWRCGM